MAVHEDVGCKRLQMTISVLGRQQQPRLLAGFAGNSGLFHVNIYMVLYWRFNATSVAGLRLCFETCMRAY